MKIENLKELRKERILTYNQLSSFSGENSLENPILIESSGILPKHLKISGSILYVHLNKCSFDSLILKRCQNIKIVDSSCEILQLENCSNIEIDGCQIKTTLYVRKCSQVKISNCSVSRLDLIRSHENYIEKSNFDEAYNDFSSGNTFKNIQIPEKCNAYLLKNKLPKKLLLIILPIVSLIMLSSSIRLWRRNRFASLWILTFLAICLLITSISNYYCYREMRKYPPNKIL